MRLTDTDAASAISALTRARTPHVTVVLLFEPEPREPSRFSTFLGSWGSFILVLLIIAWLGFLMRGQHTAALVTNISTFIFGGVIVCNWMYNFGYNTGHADGVADARDEMQRRPQ